MTPRSDDAGWRPVCRVADLEVGRGVTALVHGQAIAVFRLTERTVYALGNHDPFAAHGAGLAKGIVGRRGEVPFVGSPSHRHAFDLRTGQCLDQPQVTVPAYRVQIRAGMVLVGQRKLFAARPGTDDLSRAPAPAPPAPPAPRRPGRRARG